MIDNVIFDMDGVLFDTERLYAIAWNQVGRAMNMRDLDACKNHCVGLNGLDIRKYLLKTYGGDFPLDTFRKSIEDAFREIVRKDGLPKKDGVDELLDYLRVNGYKIALATSSRKESAVGHLRQSGLTGYFHAVVTGDMVSNGKPHPEIYRLACAMLKAVPERCIAVEDSPNGIKSAYAAGLNVIMVPDLIEPTEEIERLLFKKFDTLFDVKAFLVESR
jgi:HAD superfamily hydrolase (TIGR01509 family)